MLFGKNTKYVLFFLLSMIMFLLLKRDRNCNIRTEIVKTNLTTRINENYILNDNSDIEIYKIENNVIYGDILDFNAHPILYGTKILFKYDLITDVIYYYDIDFSGRVIDFILINDYAYYIDVVDHGNEYYEWQLKKYDISNSSLEVLRKGKIIDIINIPRIVGIYQDSLIIFILNNDGYNVEYEFLKCNSVIEKIISGAGSIENNSGNLPYNVYNYYLNDNYLYYSLIDENGSQYLYEYNLIYNEKKIVFENKTNSIFLNNYKCNKDYQYFQMIDKNSNVKVIIKDHISSNEIISKINTFDNFINSEQILFHNENNVWKILDLKSKKYIALNIDLYLYPKYFFISENMVLVKDRNSEYYTVKIVQL